MYILGDNMYIWVLIFTF